jgi:transposase
MSTEMDEDDWAHTLGVFRACLPRRGRKAQDDRRFLEALHFFTVENVRWRALPERFGPWNSVWKRFDRLSKAGVFEAFFDTLASMSVTAHLIQMFDSTIVRAHVSAAGAKGGKKTKRSGALAAASPGVSGILCARPVASSRLNEPFVEHDGELGLRLEPLARRHFPLSSGLAQDEKQELRRRVIGWKMTSRAHGAA